MTIFAIACSPTKPEGKGYSPRSEEKGDIVPPEEVVTPTGPTGPSAPTAPTAPTGPTGPSAPTGPPAVKKPKVLLVGIDGMRPDALAVANAPTLHALQLAGAVSDRAETNDTTVSGPGWSSILTGVWRDKHGVYDNTFTGKDYVAHPEILSQLEIAQPSLVTARITNWAPLHDTIPTTADIDLGFEYSQGGDVPSVAQGVTLLGQDVDVVFFYFAMVDVAGHDHGFHPSVPAYLQAIALVDAQLTQLLAAVKARKDFAKEDWLVVVTSDHGGTADKQHGRDIPEHRRVDFIVAGERIVPGTIEPPPQQVDVVPTIFDYLGLTPPLPLDGRVAKVAPPGTELVTNGDAEQDAGRVGIVMNAAVRGWEKRDGGVSTAYASGGGFPPSVGGANFFVGGPAGFAVMTQTIDTGPIGPGKVADISVDLGGYAAQNDSAELVVRFVDGDKRAAVDGQSESYFFRADQVQVYAHAAASASAPVTIASQFPDLGAFAGGARDFDGAVKWDATHAYFFKGSEVIYWDYAAVAAGHPKGRKGIGYPKLIADEWPALSRFKGGARDIGSAIVYASGNVYFFKGEEYIRLVKATGVTTADYPRFVSTETWTGFPIDGFYGVINFGRADKFYVFRHDGYWRFDIAADRVDDGYPLAVDAGTWPGLSLFATAATSARLGPVLASDRGQTTKLVHRQAVGVPVPAATLQIGVELVFRREGTSGDNDGSADNVTINLR
ncbi:MAG: alkaline phosphatase family protein [Deltaproteobacteria bacterium]|nr:alkaline phosphatase family protein [Deltaproteobacteria bacterium]